MNSSPPDDIEPASPERSGLSIRVQIVLGLAALLIPLGVVGWAASYSQAFTGRAIDELENVNARAAASAQLAASVMELERNVLLYRQTGNTKSAERTLASYPVLLAKLDTLHDGPVDPTARNLLERMRRHIENHEANFAEVVSERERRTRLVGTALVETTDALGERLSNLTGASDSVPELQRFDRVRADFDAAHAAALAFLTTPDFGLVETVTQRLDRARSTLMASRTDGNASRIDAIDALLARYESGFLSVAQATRGYLFLTNVVMAGASDEYIRLADELTGLERQSVEARNREIEERLASVQRITLAILVLSLLAGGIVALQFGGRLSARIRDITDVFNRLASGEHVATIPGRDRRDELGKLAAAADVFRSNNERTEHLLTEARRLAEVQKRTNNQLAQQVRERQRAERHLKARTADLERSNEDLAQFAYVASHDLQEPLRMVTSYVELVADEYSDSFDDTGREFIGYAIDGAQRMKQLIRSLLEYSRIGSHAEERVEVDGRAALSAALDNLGVAIDASGATITSDELPTVHADLPSLTRLLQNLIGNAIKFAGAEPPRIHVGVSRDGDSYYFSVRDNGIGFDPQYARQIFTIFQRLHARHEFPGTGIGLTICKKIVNRYGGDIWAESRPGEGTTIHFTLPVDPLAQTGAQPQLNLAS